MFFQLRFPSIISTFFSTAVRRSLNVVTSPVTDDHRFFRFHSFSLFDPSTYLTVSMPVFSSRLTSIT